MPQNALSNTNTQRPKRILVGQIWHEGHSFNPLKTYEKDFIVSRGQEMLEEARNRQTALGGIVREIDRLGHEAVPTLAALARPGGPIDDGFFQPIMEEIVVCASKLDFDAICLDLHGATTTESIADVEGELLARLRAVVGADMPIVVALDLHAYVTPRMVEHATLMTAFRTVPHADMAETGERAVRLLEQLFEDSASPRAAMVIVPLLTRGNDETSSGPLSAIGAAADSWRSTESIYDVSVFNVHHFLDVPGYGQVVLAYDRGQGAAVQACEDLASMLWSVRDEFVEALPSLKEAFDLAARSDRLVTIGDQGDRVMGGGPGDSTEIARFALNAYPDLRVALPIYDPDCVAAATAAGVGNEIFLAVGGSVTPQCEPLRAKWTVAWTGSLQFENEGPYMGGTVYDFGAGAVLRHGHLTVVLTSGAPNVHDPAFYEFVGIPLADQKLVVAKAANHYKLSFSRLGHVMTVDTSGLTAFRPQDFPFDVSRPFYPLDALRWTFEECDFVRPSKLWINKNVSA
jgi:microcystin degradation protein MlrC